MNDRPLPPSHAPAPAAAELLDAVAARWRRSPTGLPAPLLDWLADALARCRGGRLDPAVLAAEAAAALPPDWPRAEALADALGLLEAMQAECMAVLARAGSALLLAVHAVFGHARLAMAARLAGPSAASAPSLQQALAARDRQLSVATHELRTPISSILLNLQLLEHAARKQGSLDAAAVARLLAVPARQLRRLTRMVDLLLDSAQVESDRLVLHPQPLDLCQLVHDAVARLQTLAQDAGCALDLDGCEPVTGRWDRLRLEQVVTNLVTNGIKYGGRRVEIRTGAQPEPFISVHDAGAGIPEEDQQRIFEPFERLPSTASEDGAGLGLYIVREIVRAHGGRIEVASAPGRGTTFTVFLPRQPEQEQAGGQQAQRAAAEPARAARG